jgi:hypothetical protein
MVADALARHPGTPPASKAGSISAGIHAVHDDDGDYALACFDEARGYLAAEDVAPRPGGCGASTALSRLGKEARRRAASRAGFHAVGASSPKAR